MVYLRSFKKYIQIILLCFVTPCYQLVNEIGKGIPNNVIGNNLNQIANANNVNKIMTQKQPLRTASIQIVPQPLIPRRKVILNPTDSKLQSNPNNKILASVRVNKSELTPTKDIVQSKNIKTNADSEPKSEEKAIFFEDEDFDDLDIKSEKDNVEKPKLNIFDSQKNKTDVIVPQKDKDFPKSGNKIEDKRTENKEEVTSKKLPNQGLDSSSNDSKKTIVNTKNKITQEHHNQDKIKTNKKENIPPNIGIKVSDKKTNSKNMDKNNYVKSLKAFEHKKDLTNSQKHNFVKQDNIPNTIKMELNVDPKFMEKLTNDASDKILIKNCNFEELRERYNPSSDKTPEEKDYFADKQEPNKDILEDNSDFNKISIPNTNDYIDNRTPKDRVWRKWKNTEIHIKSKDVKDTEPSTKEEPKRDLCDCYSKTEFRPVEYVSNDIEQTENDNLYPIMKQQPSRYYLPAAYTSSFPSCYQPRSYGYQYAPVSRYQNYLFPCL